MKDTRRKISFPNSVVTPDEPDHGIPSAFEIFVDLIRPLYESFATDTEKISSKDDVASLLEPSDKLKGCVWRECLKVHHAAYSVGTNTMWPTKAHRPTEGKNMNKPSSATEVGSRTNRRPSTTGSVAAETRR